MHGYYTADCLRFLNYRLQPFAAAKGPRVGRNCNIGGTYLKLVFLAGSRRDISESRARCLVTGDCTFVLIKYAYTQEKVQYNIALVIQAQGLNQGSARVP